MLIKPFLVLLITLLAACSENNFEEYGPVIATVGKDRVYEKELELNSKRILGIGYSKEERIEAESKILDSIILSKMLAQKAHSGLSEQEKAEIELQVIQYRDEILAKHYIRKNIKPRIPTVEEVSEYYNANKGIFGERIDFEVDILSFDGPCPLPVKKGVVFSSKQKLESQLVSRKCEYSSKSRTFTEAEIASRYGEVDQKIGSFTLINNQGDLKAIYLKNIEKIPAKPLAEVATKIRKMLAPMHLKDALKKERLEISNEMEVKLITN